ncbi:MAG TPA: NAD(P)H-dependent oxidoreductase subunit E [Firmicutes bacterium]|jgi:NADH:ubiquinone oxidoreductase subunit E|nr:NAD(P)H-dependent oxidoreductase subunit E [Bacillota bacterium]HOQ24609.1 NAD(P)H-dependent oxidoreductase subunit E [Bacillota bacterium]HPT67807.1 NAD(P)H-dependent oxidoreductase subunit E [Bacillota bacterium]
MAESCHACSSVGCPENDAKLQQLDEIIAKYRGKPGALIPVLHQAQMLYGYLPKEVQIRVAEGLNIPLSEVYGVITFYSLFTLKPRGKHTIGVCMGTACYVKGAPGVLEALQNELGIGANDTTDDGLFSLVITRCVGACGLAPVMTIGDDVYGRLTADKIPEIIAKYKG